MDLILADSTGHDIKALVFSKCDFEVGGENDFEIDISLEDWQPEIDFGCLVYEKDSECGGVISSIETDTAENVISIKGYTWRGHLSKRIIIPPTGYDYKTISGDLNECISQIIDSMFGGLIIASREEVGVQIENFQFDRYTSVLDGLTKMLNSVSYQLKITYVQGEAGAAGYVLVSAVPIEDYSSDIELSQDSRINFTIEINKGSVNHLICLGSGELKDREVLNLYLDNNGNIGDMQFYQGINEITEVYENSNTEDLRTDGINKFKELLSGTSLSMNVEMLNLDINIGDIIGGRDYITGITVKKALKSKIITFEDGVKSVQYNLEE